MTHKGASEILAAGSCESFFRLARREIGVERAPRQPSAAETACLNGSPKGRTLVSANEHEARLETGGATSRRGPKGPPKSHWRKPDFEFLATWAFALWVVILFNNSAIPAAAKICQHSPFRREFPLHHT
jgi:hypothetical protein